MTPTVETVTEAERAIPEAAILLPFLVVVTGLMVWRLRRRSGPVTAPRVLVGLLACGYAAAVLDAVLLPYQVGAGSQGADVPWHVWVNLVPLADDDLSGLWLNILLFVPLGVILPLVLARASAGRVLLAGFVVSLSIEVVQLMGALTISPGRVADVDDLLANTLGTLAGYALFRAVTLVPRLRRLAAAVTWPPRASAETPAGHRRLREPARTSGRGAAGR